MSRITATVCTAAILVLSAGCGSSPEAKFQATDASIPARIQSFPIPKSAVVGKKESGNLEKFTVPGATAADLSDWYARVIPPGTPWGEWRECYFKPLRYRPFDDELRSRLWYREGDVLQLMLNEANPAQGNLMLWHKQAPCTFA